MRKLLNNIKNYFIYKETKRELSRLSEKELEDIGLSRWQLEQIVRNEVFSK